LFAPLGRARVHSQTDIAGIMGILGWVLIIVLVLVLFGGLRFAFG
jgi:hypothetical protein